MEHYSASPPDGGRSTGVTTVGEWARAPRCRREALPAAILRVTAGFGVPAIGWGFGSGRIVVPVGTLATSTDAGELEGAGIDLATARRVVERPGRRLTAGAAVARGASCCCTLPEAG